MGDSTADCSLSSYRDDSRKASSPVGLGSAECGSKIIFALCWSITSKSSPSAVAAISRLESISTSRIGCKEPRLHPPYGIVSTVGLFHPQRLSKPLTRQNITSTMAPKVNPCRCVGGVLPCHPRFPAERRHILILRMEKLTLLGMTMDRRRPC